ncbi:hypothetical protein [Micromonospora sp. NPDC047740]
MNRRKVIVAGLGIVAAELVASAWLSGWRATRRARHDVADPA